MKIRKIKQKGQVWVETVLYTLIGIALIGLVLGFAMPKINERRDTLLVEQSIEALQVFDQKIGEVMTQSVGSKRLISDFILKRGDMHIKGSSDKIEIVLEGLGSAYSQPDKIVSYGKVSVLTGKGQKFYNVTLSITPGVDIAYKDDKNRDEKFGNAATPYQFSIEHKTANNADYVNIEEISGSG